MMSIILKLISLIFIVVLVVILFADALGYEFDWEGLFSPEDEEEI